MKTKSGWVNVDGKQLYELPGTVSPGNVTTVEFKYQAPYEVYSGNCTGNNPRKWIPAYYDTHQDAVAQVKPVKASWNVVRQNEQLPARKQRLRAATAILVVARSRARDDRWPTFVVPAGPPEEGTSWIEC